MRVFNIESFLCTFHRTVWVLCYFALLQEHKKEIMYFLPIAIKVESSSLHLLFTAFHLDPLEGLKALLFIWSSGKRFFFSLKLILMYFKELPSIIIIHLSSYYSKTIPLEMKSFPKSVLAACFRQERRHWHFYQYSEMWQKPAQEHRVIPTTVPTVRSLSATRREMLMCLTNGIHRDTHSGNKTTMNWLKLVSQKAPYQEVLKWRVKHAHTESRPYPASKTEE